MEMKTRSRRCFTGFYILSSPPLTISLPPSLFLSLSQFFTIFSLSLSIFIIQDTTPFVYGYVRFMTSTTQD